MAAIQGHRGSHKRSLLLCTPARGHWCRHSYWHPLEMPPLRKAVER